MKIRLADGTGTRDYRHVWVDVDRRGNERIYFARKRKPPKIRLYQKPGSAEFDLEYQRAFRGERSPAPGTAPMPVRAPVVSDSLRWLCEQYYASAGFQQLGETTRKVRRGILDGICARQVDGEPIGTFPYRGLEPQHVAKLRDEKAALPEAANARVKALRQVFRWACSPEYGHATRNPAREVGYLESNNPGGFKPWSEADILKYEARHPVGTKARLALDLLLYFGVRRSDVVILGPQMERWFTETLPDGSTIRVQKLCFTEYKGRRRIEKVHELPILPAMRASIDATPSGQLAYLVTEFGQPYSRKGFGNWFKRRCREAGVDSELSAHGLRKFGASRAAEMGATEHELMALYGWETTKQAGLYTRNASRRRLEGRAAALLDRSAQTRNESLPPFRVVASGGSKRGKK